VSGTLILTWHAVEAGGAPPLCVAPELLARQLDRIAAAGAEVVTVSELGRRRRAGTLPGPAVAITFDDGFASIAAHAAPLLQERGLVATIFCVAGKLGGESDWAGAGERRPLLTADGVAQLAAAGWEIGAHGLTHAPLGEVEAEEAGEELIESRRLLEQVTGAPVTSLAYPYGSLPVDAAALARAAGYAVACTTELRRVAPADDPFLLPRVDVHYLRRLDLLERALAGRSNAYLRARRLAARARRLVRADYA